MILVATVVPSSSFRDKRKAVFLVKFSILKNICERLLLNFKDKLYVKLNFSNLNSTICLFPIGWTSFFSVPDNSCYKFNF